MSFDIMPSTCDVPFAQTNLAPPYVTRFRQVAVPNVKQCYVINMSSDFDIKLKLLQREGVDIWRQSISILPLKQNANL